MLDPVAELNLFDDFGQTILPAELAPFLLGREHQLVRHRQRRLAAETAFGLDCAMPDRGEGALDRVRGPDMFPLLGGEVVVGEQVGAVLGQAFRRAVVFHAVSRDEEIEGGVG